MRRRVMGGGFTGIWVHFVPFGPTREEVCICICLSLSLHIYIYICIYIIIHVIIYTHCMSIYPYVNTTY